MLTLFSYPGLCGLADNNPFGLKVHAFLVLSKVAFRHQHVMDASDAPRGQLPYIIDGTGRLGDSDAIIAHVTRHYPPTIDDGPTAEQHARGFLIGRVLDDLYWVMSYSRWRDDRFWPSFRDTFRRAYPAVTAEMLQAARDHNFRRYDYQGIGRYDAEAAYARGCADLAAIARVLPDHGFMFGVAPRSVDCAIHGFVANIIAFDIDTPLKRCVLAHPPLAAHVASMQEMLNDAGAGAGGALTDSACPR